MLVALLKDGRPISLVDRWTRVELIRLKQQETFFCPACEREVILKLGNRRIPHFAHKKEGMCAFEHEAESSTHLAGKMDLFRWLQKQSINVKLEPYFHSIQQRPDLFVVVDQRAYALEYQCSPISEALFRKRNNYYKKAGIRPIWIMGAHHLRHLSLYRFKLSRFHWLFAQHVSLSSQPLLFYYCPETKQMFRLVRFIPFSPYCTFAIPLMNALSSLSFDDLLSYPSVPLPDDFWSEWLSEKKKWRLTFTMYPNKTNRRICSDFYHHRILPPLFPPEAGWPLSHSYLFETPPFIWQTYVLIELSKYHEVIPLSSIYALMNEKIAARIVTVRTLPLANLYHYSRAVYEYLQLLTQLGYIEWKSRHTLQLIKPLTLPKTMDEAVNEDKRLLEAIKIKSGQF
ncbi:competence protein CoiA [Thermaerobacillus caldiproteolyticus]|uniref:Competence CoiA-like predicted nuclease n=1 Tax=Thermaerobacillus caldiproteolyticus TaxID=247480 RepID=A0A7V9Z6L2_9BACL|nr:competence protein CoiA family protein [Anoxybacillus caldiproteolyticus]MBA2874936.1 competence CoiA-like predicted nuclease [Anoxybacillus caldiproteolyticus]